MGRCYIIFLGIGICFLPLISKCQRAIEIRRYKIDDSIHLQGVAVDDTFFYVISNASVYKYKKTDGSLVGFFDGKKKGSLKHLNSGVILDGKLYCAHSNFPDSPMASSIEVFDTKTMKHLWSHSFGIVDGSATWIDRKNGYWWVAFANYDGKYSVEGRDNRWTELVQFTKNWQKVASWVYPKNVLKAFSPYSNSGGTWGFNNELLVTGHDRKELYVLKIPECGFTLEYVRTISIINNGQGIALDRFNKIRKVLYGVSRRDNSIIVERFVNP